MDAATGRVISLWQQRPRHQEWLTILRLTDEATPADRQIHLIADNYATHKHDKVQQWLRRHPRFHVHFTPTSASWLNMVERFFRDLTENRLKRGVFRSVLELIEALDGYVDNHNEEPKPFIWTAKAQDILAKVMRARTALNNGRSVLRRPLAGGTERLGMPVVVIVPVLADNHAASGMKFNTVSLGQCQQLCVNGNSIVSSY